MARKKISLRDLGSKIKGSSGSHLKTAITYFGIESLAKELGKKLGDGAKDKIFSEPPRAKLLKRLQKLQTTHPDSLKKMATRLSQTKKNYTENDFVTLLCKLITEEEKKDIETLNWLINLPTRGGFTFQMALDLLEHDKWQQLAQRGMNFVKKYTPQKIEKGLGDFSEDMNTLCDEIDLLF